MFVCLFLSRWNKMRGKQTFIRVRLSIDQSNYLEAEDKTYIMFHFIEFKAARLCFVESIQRLLIGLAWLAGSPSAIRLQLYLGMQNSSVALLRWNFKRYVCLRAFAQICSNLCLWQSKGGRRCLSGMGATEGGRWGYGERQMGMRNGPSSPALS